MNYTRFHSAILRGTVFDGAVINRPLVDAGGFTESINLGEIHGISVAGADISAISHLPDMTKVFGSDDTLLSSELDFWRRQTIDRNNNMTADDEGDVPAHAIDANEVRDSQNFSHWFPYKRTDMAFGWSYRKFMKGLGLVDWPH